jgi:hypothetical protein
MINTLRLILVLALASGPLWAGPVPSQNVIVLDSAPRSLRNGQLESNTHAFLFFERSFVASEGHTADMGGFGAGALVNSHYLHFDPIGSSSVIDPDGMMIRFTFETQILGIDYLSASLNAGDAGFGNALTEYRTGDALRGSELWNRDSIEIAADGRTILFDFKTWYENADEFRVFTAGAADDADAPTPNPEPGTLVLLGAALAGAAVMRRRRASARVRR